jgi:hypothetical protein
MRGDRVDRGYSMVSFCIVKMVFAGYFLYFTLQKYKKVLEWESFFGKKFV